MLKRIWTSKAELLDWGDIRGFKTKFLRTFASHYLTELLTKSSIPRKRLLVKMEKDIANMDNPIKHPLATKDKGFYSA